MPFFVSLWLPVLIWICVLFAKGSPHSLGILFVYSNSSQYNSTEALDGVQEAIDNIEYEDILPGYRVQIIVEIDIIECNDESSTIKRLLKYITNPIPSQTLIAIISGGCSPATDAMIGIAEYQNISLISYTPNTVKQSINYYQLHPSDEPVIQTLATVIKFYGWSQISIITEVENKFMMNEKLLIKYLALLNITVPTTIHVWSHENISNNMQLFRDNDARIYFLNTFEDMAKKVLCEAYNKGIYYPDYGWLFHGWYNEDWLLSDPSVHCTTQQLTKVVERGIVIQQYTEEDKRSSISSYGYDAVWSLGVALNSTLNMINDNTVNESSCIGPFSPLYNRSSGTDCLLRYNLLNTEFIGKSGDVSFNANGIRKLGTLHLQQYRNFSLRTFAAVNKTSGDIVYIPNENNSTVWPDGPPPDGSPIEVKTVYSVALVAITYTWASLGIVFSIVCLMFIIVFRKRKIVRLTTPNLNYFIAVGITILYSSTFFSVHTSHSEHFVIFSCIANIWALAVGITLFFGPILAKMLRIYYIFSNPTTKKKVITDKHLVVFVLIIESITLVLLILGTAIPQTRPGPFYDVDREYCPKKNEKGILVEYYGLNCYSQMSFIWFIIIIMYIGILEIIAVILAVKTRNIKIKAVNDSKDVIDIVYIVALASVCMMIFAYVLQDYSNIGTGFFIVSMLLAATGTITLTFVPKMWSLYKDPDGKNVFEKESTVPRSSFISKQNGYIDKAILSETQEMKPMKSAVIMTDVSNGNTHHL